jgi:hypothetical protein
MPAAMLENTPIRPAGLEPADLEATIVAIDDRLEVADEDVRHRLRRGRALLELELAELAAE